MTQKDATKTKVGDKLRWKSDGMLGEVCEVGYGGFKVKWADGKHGIYMFHDLKTPWEVLERVRPNTSEGPRSVKELFRL